jgi:radical SAM superfamily enzyme YgiQ (UPF0313 family)
MPKTVTVADLSITTVAAMAPQDFHIEVADQHVQTIGLEHPAEVIGLTGKITQYNNMIRLAEEFRRRGKLVVIGGPFASLAPEMVRDHCDILVEGEMEEIADEFFADLRAGTWKDHYKGTQPDLKLSPVPRWELYRNDRALSGAVQTSRGCPFECEFCDVIQYLGRKQRHKEPSQVIRELEVLYQLGYNKVFLSDDNFTVFRRRTKDLLEALIEWNDNLPNGHLIFMTQLSIDIADDTEMLQMCAAAGMTSIFIGIETPSEESLREAKKRQNMGIPLVERIQRFIDHGMVINGGMICGFDHDGYDIFERQFHFAMQTSVPIFTLGALVAPQATPLYERMKRDGRLVGYQDDKGDDAVAATPWHTNLTPMKMSREELYEGIKWLANNLYSPESFGTRLSHFIDTFGRELPESTLKKMDTRLNLRPIDLEFISVVRRLPRMGEAEAKLWDRIAKQVTRKPMVRNFVMMALMQYMQVRYMYSSKSFWEPSLSAMPQPTIAISHIG